MLRSDKGWKVKNVRLRDMKTILKAPIQSEKCFRETRINTGDTVYKNIVDEIFQK